MAMRQMVFGLTLTAIGLAFSADVTWTGSGGVVDWSAATWSTGTPPAATDTVKFKPSVHAPDFTVTPPADFTGKIMLLTYSSAASIGGDYFPGRIRIVNSNNAAFTVGAGGSDGGISVIEAFSGLEQMIDASYSQVVDIPSGVTFAPTAGFPSGVTFTGVGTFRPATVAQLEHAHAFRGVLDLRGLENLDLAQVDSLLLGRDVILGTGASFNENHADKLVSNLHMTDASDWTLNSPLASETPACCPTVDASGKLTLPHVAGVHNRTTAFLNRRFKADESFVAKFKLSIEANEYISGFGIVMHDGEATDVGSGTSTIGDNAIPSRCYGLATLFWNSWGGNITVLERLPGRTSVGDWEGWRGYQQGMQAGLTLRNGNPFDVVVTCHDKVLSVALTQDGVTRTYRQDASGAFSGARGALFGFFTHEHSADSPSINVSISDFEGWVSSAANSPWQEDPDFALNADNYHTYVDYKASSGADVTSLRGADAFDASGRLRLCEGCGWFGAAVSKNVVADGSKLRVKWTIDVGTRANNGQFTDIGFVQVADDATLRSRFGNYDVADGSGWNTGGRKWFNAGDPLKIELDWWNSKVGLTHSAENSKWTADPAISGMCGANSSDAFALYYDGEGVCSAEVVNSADGVVHSFSMSNAVLGSNRRFAVVAGANTDFGWQSYTKNWMRDLSFCRWDDTCAPSACTRVIVPTAGTSEVAGLGAYAPFERITLGDTASRARVTGRVAFGDTLVIKVPENFIKSIRASTRLVDLSSATVSGSNPSTVTLVGPDGNPIALRGRTLTVDANGITLSGPNGFLIVFR